MMQQSLADDFADSWPGTLRLALLKAGMPDTGIAVLDESRIAAELEQTELGQALSAQSVKELSAYLTDLAAKTCPLSTLVEAGGLWVRGLRSHRAGHAEALRLLERSVSIRTAYDILAQHSEPGAAVIEQRWHDEMVAAGWQPKAARRWLKNHPERRPPVPNPPATQARATRR